jgi:DNA-binding GntR family transcriptional regulator
MATDSMSAGEAHNEVVHESALSSGSARLTTADVYEKLRRKILDHSIPPATKVNIHHISQEFGVSPTPVREALRLLQGDNLLVATSNKGYATTEILDLAGVRDLFEFRLLIEPWAARIAASNRLANPAKILAAELEHFDTSTDSMQHTLISHDSRFHNAILASTNNQTVIQAFTQSHCHMHLFRIYSLDWPWQATIQEHERIRECIQAADPVSAEKAMRDHLYGGYERFSKAVAKSPTESIPLRAAGAAQLVAGSQKA